jgi:hypothetical protein
MPPRGALRRLDRALPPEGRGRHRHRRRPPGHGAEPSPCLRARRLRSRPRARTRPTRYRPRSVAASGFPRRPREPSRSVPPWLGVPSWWPCPGTKPTRCNAAMLCMSPLTRTSDADAIILGRTLTRLAGGRGGAVDSE